MDERIADLIDEALQRLNQLHENEMTLLTAQIGHSIGLFYFTTSLKGLCSIFVKYFPMSS